MATFPIQALLVVILGDNFPWNDPPDALSNIHAMLDTPQFQKLGDRAEGDRRSQGCGSSSSTAS